MPPTDERIILTYSEPPPQYGFTQSKSGKSWWRKTTLNEARIIASELAAIDIHGKIMSLKSRQKLPYHPRKPRITNYTARAGQSLYRP